jgi:predicted deacetylase
MSARAIVVSIHDVSPLTQAPVTRILAELSQANIPRVSLLVVPDHHHQGNVAAKPEFATWLHHHVEAGHEPVLHGYSHMRERHSHEPMWTRLVTRHYTADEGEFFDIRHDAAREILARGRDAVARAAGVAPEGFIAPAWLLSAEGEAAAREAGFAYTTRLKTVTALQSAHVLTSQSLCWSVRSSWRRTLSLAWNDFLFARLRGNQLLRVSIHPPDISYPTTWQQILRLVTSGANDRTPLTYREFVAQSPVFQTGTTRTAR